MKVLIVHPCKGFYGGAEEVVVQFCKYLMEGEDYSILLVTKDAPKDLYKNLTHEVYQSLTIVDRDSYIGIWRYIREFINWADVVCCFNFPATLATFPTKKPIVWYCNEPPELFTTWWRQPVEAFNRWWVRKSDMKCIVADRLNALRFQDIYGIEPQIIPYGIDYNFWSQGEREKKGFILLQVGHPELFPQGREIFQRVQRFIPSAELIQVIKATHEEVRDRYYEASVLIHPIDSHGGWLVPFEAMCTGLPVIVSDWFTGADIIYKNNLGIVDFDIASSILAKVYERVDTERAKEWVKENLTWEKFGEGMVKVLEEAIG